MIKQHRKTSWQSKIRLVMAAGRLQIIYLLSACRGETCRHMTPGIFFFSALTIIWANTDQNALSILHCMHLSITINSLKELNNPVSNQKLIGSDHHQLAGIQAYSLSSVIKIQRLKFSIQFNHHEGVFFTLKEKSPFSNQHYCAKILSIKLAALGKAQKHRAPIWTKGSAEKKKVSMSGKWIAERMISAFVLTFHLIMSTRYEKV